MIDGRTFDAKAALIAQRALCEAEGYPFFAPRDGVCWVCRRQIYEEFKGCGITVEGAGRALVTGCPHCCRSYCE